MPGRTRQTALSRNNTLLDTSYFGERSLELAALLNDLTADRLPLLGDREMRSVGVSTFGGASLADRADVLLRLSLELDDELGGDTFTRRCRGMSHDSVSMSNRSQPTVWLLLPS